MIFETTMNVIHNNLNNYEKNSNIQKKISKDVKNPDVQTKYSKDEKKSDVQRENDVFIKNQQKEIKDVLKTQEVSLDQLEKNIDKLNTIAKTINGEAKLQYKYIEDLNHDIENANVKISVTNNSLDKFLKFKDSCDNFWTIIILTFILIMLICLVIWT